MINKKLISTLVVGGILFFSPTLYGQETSGLEKGNVQKVSRSVLKEKAQYAYLLKKEEWSSRLPKPNKNYAETVLGFLQANHWMLKPEFREAVLEEKIIPAP